jgi:hypothetical protein
MNLSVQLLDPDVQGHEAITAIQPYGCPNKRPINIDNMRLQHAIPPAQLWSGPYLCSFEPTATRLRPRQAREDHQNFLIGCSADPINNAARRHVNLNLEDGCNKPNYT